ncbi:MAG TPA: AglZ/HisF2 family acetamidino modification protein [Vicinamibacterales bacterium]|jgi:cyclase
MLTTRVIPFLLLKGAGLYKTVRFAAPTYLGDPVNIVRIFNEKEVDEVFVADIGATPARRGPNLAVLRDLASECFMPLGYGGGVKSLRDAEQLYQLGIEKVAVNTAAVENPALVSEIAAAVGSQSVVVSIDVKRTFFGRYDVVTRCGTVSTGRTPADFAREMEQRGAGEIVLTSIDRDGTMQGYDLELIRSVTSVVGVPVIASGGAGSVRHFVEAVRDAGASAVAAGSLFVFQGPRRAVLINVPDLGPLADVSASVEHRANG